MDLSDLTIKDTTDKLKSGIFSCREIVEECFATIKKNDKKINAFLTLNEKKALKTADEYDGLIKKDKNIFNEKHLIGIPIAFKDLFSTKNIRTTAGSKIIGDYYPPFNATAV